MLRFLTSLSFLYVLVIAALLVYGLVYYRDFARSARQRNRFPFVFAIIGMACFAFLWVNIHAPLKLRTFNNLDHHFIRHDGFMVTGKIALGKTDTVNFTNNASNNFEISKGNNTAKVNAAYSEEPFYISEKGHYRIASHVYAAIGHNLSFKPGVQAGITVNDDSKFELILDGTSIPASKQIRRGISAWNLFKDEDAFINSPHFSNQELIASLRQVFIIRDNVTKRGGEELKIFLSGRIFQYSKQVSYDQRPLKPSDLAFSAEIPAESYFAWGIGFLDNNKNQFYWRNGGGDSFAVLYRYPVSYPLTEERQPHIDRSWSNHSVTKFLLADSKDMLRVPAVFREGFLFPAFERDQTASFDPVLLTYQAAASNKPVGLKVARLDNPSSVIDIRKESLLLPARSQDFDWMFSLRNTFNWEYGNGNMNIGNWQLLLFGALFFFFILVLATSMTTAPNRLSWVWQLLSCITMVLLTTRFFLYWRYKSFPPYEGMDLPSQQQLQGFWNFGIIIFATLVLAIVFGFGFIRYMVSLIRRREINTVRDASIAESSGKFLSGLSVVKRYGARMVFFIAWTLLLVGGAVFAYIRNFDPGTCRHLAIALTVMYFIFVFISYRHSPLVVLEEKSWWRINTSRTFDLLISNPVKVLLSISLLGIFVFIDIGFAIVFLNFLLFNEAFLCINYAIAGLSTGSKRNATLFGSAAAAYLFVFIANLLYAPYIFKTILNLPQSLYLAGYIFFAIVLTYHLLRVMPAMERRKKIFMGSAITVLFFVVAFFFFPKEKIVDKAAMTKYRIEVLTTPVDNAIELAYKEGKTWEPVIRAAQNQWFINTFSYEENNPGVQSPGFQLLPHAPQNKGAKYNAQATDLVASRFFLAEHGKWAVLLYVLLLLLPTVLLASFYKLYPDFTNRINERYPTITAGFSILNYLLITALLVILAATGRYIFFGQDMPFGSILSKQSILFPAILIITTVLLFKNISLEYYANRKKLIPGFIVFAVLGVMLFFVKPSFNKNKEFNTGELSGKMGDFIQVHLQPLMDYFDTAATTRRYPIAKKDRLFTDSLRKLIARGSFADAGNFFVKEADSYSRLDFARHLDQSRMLYLDLYSGRPQLTFNDNYFRVEPPPHLQQSWTGNVYGDSTIYNISMVNASTGTVTHKRVSSFANEPDLALDDALTLSFISSAKPGRQLYLFNTGNTAFNITCHCGKDVIGPRDSMLVPNPWKVRISSTDSSGERLLMVEPDALMKNYYVNGSRFYIYPMSNRFTWARNFAESIASEYTNIDQPGANAAVSLDVELMDSLSFRIQKMMNRDTAYKKGAEYAITIADGNGRLLAMTDYIKEFERPDPNDKAGFNKALTGENGFVSQSLLRKQIGNINLLRLNPGPGSTLKPIVFSAIASQLNLDWDHFASEGFNEQQEYFGGQKVAEYDFEKNNGTIRNVVDYLKYSDNYYYSNVLLLGSYPKQNLDQLLSTSFVQQNPAAGLHWPWFTYNNERYWLNGFKNWPGYENGEVNFGSDSSFTSIGLSSNYGIYTHEAGRSFDFFGSAYDSSLFLKAYRKSGFLLPEYALFDQYGANVNKRIAYDVFASCFRGHVKGSSQVMIPPVKMTEAFGIMVSQNRNYSLTLNPYAKAPSYAPFVVDSTIGYNNYLSLLREGVFRGLKEVLKTGTAARIGTLLPAGSKYFYYGKTGTTGDNESKTKSKLFAIVISEKDIADPGFNFRNNKFYTIYFTSQNGPAKQNEEFQAEIIRFVEESAAFRRYMLSK